MKNEINIYLTLQNGQTPLSIAQKLGYISVVEALKGVTTADGSTPQSDEKYRVVAPETMQETFMSDSEDENGEFPSGRINCVRISGQLKVFFSQFHLSVCRTNRVDYSYEK